MKSCLILKQQGWGQVGLCWPLLAVLILHARQISASECSGEFCLCQLVVQSLLRLQAVVSPGQECDKELLAGALKKQLSHKSENTK